MDPEIFKWMQAKANDETRSALLPLMLCNELGLT